MICKDCIHNTVCCEQEEDRQALKFCSDYFNLITELEKIKAEFDNDLNLYKNEYDGTYNCSLDYIKGIITCKTIIEKHIEGLKGEQNDR